MSDLYLTRVTLIGNIKDNKEEAWSEFCKFYWDVITGWARQLGCSDAVAKDIFQESIVSLMRQLPHFDYDVGKGRFRSFMKTIVKRRVYDMYRKEGKYVSLTPAGGDEENDSDIAVLDKIQLERKGSDITYDSDLVWLDSLLKKAVRNIAEKMDPVTYLSFKLYVLEERPVEEVIKVTAVDKIGTVYQHKSRFLSALKKEFYELLNSTCEGGEVGINQVSDKLFNQTLAHVIAGRVDLKTTIVDNFPPEELLSRLSIIKTLVNEVEDKTENNIKYLIIIDDGKKKKILFDKSLTVGRSDKADIKFDYDDISSIHATFGINDSDDTVIKDEFSTNGTYINGIKIKKTEKIISGDIIQFGANSAVVLL